VPSIVDEMRHAGLSDAQTFRFDVGDLTYRVACGKLRRPKLDPDY
jgi:hypothetical protein